MTKSEVKLCLQACINEYGGEHGKVKEVFVNTSKFKGGIDQGHFGLLGHTLYIVICGTNSTADWISNFKATYDGADEKIKAHHGFFKGYLSVRDAILFKAEPYKNIIVTGHSRGAALSVLAARDIMYHSRHIWCKEKKIQAVLFGSPRVYNKYGADDYDFSGIKTLNFQASGDPVCGVPLVRWGYKHVAYIVKLGKSILWPWRHRPMVYQKEIDKITLE